MLSVVTDKLILREFVKQREKRAENRASHDYWDKETQTEQI